MGQNKKELNLLLDFIKQIYSNPDNSEFAAGIQSMILNDIKINDHGSNSKIDEIYEYCLNKNLHEQAEDLYKNFPIATLHSNLIENYVKMEEARRRNDFDEFGLHLYQQIESIVNYLIKDPNVISIIEKLRKQPSSMEINRYSNPNGKVSQRHESKSIESFLIYVDPNADPNSIKKDVEGPINKQFATEKFKFILYFVCYGGRYHLNLSDEWINKTTCFSEIYNVRNHVHSGCDFSDRQKEKYLAVTANKSQSYLKFISFLLFFIEGVEKGYPLTEELVEWANSI